MAKGKGFTEKDYSKLLKSKAFKNIGAQDIIPNGSSVSLLLDPNKMGSNVKRNIASGKIKGFDITQGTGQQSSQSPFDASYFEGVTSHFANLTIHDKMRLAMRYYKTEPLVGKIIEFMAVYTVDGFKNVHPDPKIKNFYDDWCAAVNINRVLGWISLEYFKTGNVPTWRELVPWKTGGIDLQNDALYLSTSAKKKSWTKKMIPGVYTILNPLTIYVDGVVGFRDSLWYIPPMNDNIKVEASNTSDFYDVLVRHLPTELSDKQSLINGNIRLSDKNIRRVLRMRMPYEPYGNVMMERAFAAIHEKNKMRQMDLTMVNSVINQIIKVTIGNNEYPASPRQLNSLANSFNNVGKSQTIFWNHTLQIEVIRPDTKVLNNEKYERVDNDIRAAFGMPAILTGESGGRANFPIAYLSVKTMLANLIDARREILDWLVGEYKDIAEAMGFDGYPTPMFNELALTDEATEKGIIMQMLDRGIITYETAQTMLGVDPDVEEIRRAKELKLYNKGLIGPLVGSPYNTPGGMPGAPATRGDTQGPKESAIQKIENQEDPQNKDETGDTKTLKKIESKREPGLDKPVPKKSGDTGRPKTGRGNYPRTRKSAASDGVEQLELEDLPPLEEKELLSVAEEFKS